MAENNPVSKVNTALSHIKNRNFNQAIEIYKEICQKEDDNTQAWLTLGMLNAEIGSTDDSIRCLEKAISTNPQLPEPHYKIAQINRKTGNLQEAITHLQEAIKKNESYKEAWVLLGATYLELFLLQEAETATRKALTLDPNLPDAHFLLGRIQYDRGNTADALESFMSTLRVSPEHAKAHARAGAILQKQGHLEEAEEHYKQSIEKRPNQPRIIFNLGLIQQENELFAEAEACYTRGLSLKPDYVPAHANLGTVYRRRNKLPAAIKSYLKALEYDPEHARTWFMLGKTQQDLHRNKDAIHSYKKSSDFDPDNASTLLNLAVLQHKMGDYNDALVNFRCSSRLNPESAEAHYGEGTSLVSKGEQPLAIKPFNKALQIRPDYPEALLGLASAYMTLQKPEDSLKYCKRAIQIDDNNINAHALEATIYSHMGMPEKAHNKLSTLLDENTDNVNIVLSFSIICKKIDRQGEAIRHMERLLENKKLTASACRNLHFNLGKVYDSVGSYDKAFSHFDIGNALKRATFDHQNHAAEIQTMTGIFSQRFLFETGHSTITSNKPVFVVGMVRSGTSLVEQILASHPQIHGAGELTDIIQLVSSLHLMLEVNEQYPLCIKALTRDKLDIFASQYLSRINKMAPDALRVIDKMPGNFMHLGLIELLFPNSRIIHCIRDPRDTCLSAYFQDFSRSHPYSCNLSDLGTFYKSYQAVMRHWKNVLRIPIMDVHYEELVSNQEETSRKLVDFCELEWDSNCLNFHKTERFVGTASFDQVNEPMYSKSVSRWKNYENHIGALLDALD